MIEKLIAFLQWIQKSEKLKNRVDFIFSMLFLFVTGVGVYRLLQEILFRTNYGYYPGLIGARETWTLRSDFTENGLIFSLTVFLLFSLICVYIYGIYKRITSKDFSVIGLIVNSALPIFVGIIITALYASERSFAKWYILLFGGLYTFSAYMLFISGFLKENHGIWSALFTLYKKYTIAFLIGLSVFIILFFFGNFRELRYMDFSEIVLLLSMIFIPFAIITWIILTYAWTTLEDIDEVSYKKILKGGVALALVFTIIWLSPNWKNVIIDDRIDTAQNLLIKHGETQEGYRKAASVWGLEWAMKERYLENRLYNKDLYVKIYDQSIESAIEDEIDVNKYRSWNSNATTMLARGKNAKVELNFAKHESLILSDIGAIATTVTYEFQNTDIQNQEVIYSIELPSTESAMTDLRLGLNLELIGVLAPRGAAEKVYEDSLRRNIDPALLEQTGPTTYRLRVFPVLSKNDHKTQGRQRVQFTYVTPLHAGEMVTLIPKTDILNLKLTEKSEIMTRVSEGTKVLLQDSEKSEDIETLNAGKRAKLDTNMSKDIGSFCSVNTYRDLDMTKFATGEKTLSKNIVFLDISKSAGEDKQIQKRYQELINTWKNNGVALDIYSFNTAVTSVGYDISDLDFWGTTDMTRVITYISENNIENANIVILTDDNSYELALPENKNIDYKKIKSNRISLIQIGEKIRTLKTEVTKAILASEGEVMTLGEDGSLEEDVKNLFSTQKKNEQCETYSGSSLPTLQAIQGNIDGKKVFGNDISNKDFLRKVRSEDIFSGGIQGSVIQELIGLTPLVQKESLLNGIIEDSQIIIVRNIAGSPLLVFDNGEVLGFSSFETMIKYKIERLAKYTGKYIEVIDYAPFNKNDSEILGSLDINIKYEIYLGKPIPFLSNWTVYAEKISDSEIQKNISTSSHIVNQSMSLIALETDEQRRDLERYSEQKDKYDTDYQNFSPGESTRNNWNSRREIIMEDRIMPTSSMNIGPNNAFFDTQKASISMGSSTSNSLRGGTTFSSGGDGSKGGVLQYILIIILFPLIAWFVLRRKPKSLVGTKNEEVKTTE